MASIAKIKDKWRAQLYVGGVRESACFSSLDDAKAWADSRTHDLKYIKKYIDASKNNEKHEKLAFDSTYSEEDIVVNSRPRFDTCGIYFLILKKKIVYVGQSINIYKRLDRHKGKKEFDSVTFIDCHPDDLTRLEAAYIAKFQPPLNAMGKKPFYFRDKRLNELVPCHP